MRIPSRGKKAHCILYDLGLTGIGLDMLRREICSFFLWSSTWCPSKQLTENQFALYPL